MAAIPGGTFSMHDDETAVAGDDEGPVRCDRRYPHMYRAVVTTSQFATFAKPTGYRTDGERFGWSFVFSSFVPEHVRQNDVAVANAPWWVPVSGAY